jgi:hypothetical protein
VGDVIELWRWWGNMNMWWRQGDIGLMLPLNQRWFLSLLLLAKNIDHILQHCEPYLLSINVLPVSFGAGLLPTFS